MAIIQASEVTSALELAVPEVPLGHPPPDPSTLIGADNLPPRSSKTKLPVPRKKNEAYQRWRKALARFTMTPYQDPGWVCEEDWKEGGDSAQRQES